MAESKKNRDSGQAAWRKKAGVKKAKKAIARAEESVAAARKAVKGSRKKLRRMVSSLSEETERLSAEHAVAVEKTESAIEASRRDTTPDPSETDQAQATTAEPTLVVTAAPPPRQRPAPTAAQNVSLTPPLPSPQPAAGTLVELRQQAREKNIPGYSRLDKAKLIEALEAAQRA